MRRQSLMLRWMDNDGFGCQFCGRVRCGRLSEIFKALAEMAGERSDFFVHNMHMQQSSESRGRDLLNMFRRNWVVELEHMGVRGRKLGDLCLPSPRSR